MRITVPSLSMLERHWRVIVVFLATMTALSACVSTSALAENDRIALVIGNSKYFHFRSLPNADNDAHLLHKTLTGMGFDAGAGALTDLTKLRLERALQQFARKARSAKIAVVYYAGHGMEISGKNYLIPIDAELASNEEADYEAIDLDLLMKSLSGASDLGLILLDACRNDPFRSERRSRFRSNSGVPFAEVRRSAELNKIAVGFAAASGALAADGNDGNSPYAVALAKYLPEPLEFDDVLAKVGQEVERITGGLQSPYLDARSALLLDIYLTKPIEVDYLSFKKMLAGLGYYKGAINSAWDDATRSSLKKFQADNHLPETGDLDQPSQAVLKVLWSIKEKEQETIVANIEPQSVPAAVSPPVASKPKDPEPAPVISSDLPNTVLPPAGPPAPEQRQPKAATGNSAGSGPKAPPGALAPGMKTAPPPLAQTPAQPSQQGAAPVTPEGPKGESPAALKAEPPPGPPVPVPRAEEPKPEPVTVLAQTPAQPPQQGAAPITPEASIEEPPATLIAEPPIPVPRAEQPKPEPVTVLAQVSPPPSNRVLHVTKQPPAAQTPPATPLKAISQPETWKRPTVVVKTDRVLVKPAAKNAPPATPTPEETAKPTPEETVKAAPDVKIEVPAEGVQVAMVHPPPIEKPVLPRNTFRDCPECPLMVRIPAGTFLMGSAEFEPGRDDDEGPQHTVSVGAFAMGKFEVTFAEWDACLSDGGCGGYSPRDFGWGRGAYPVIEIRWENARDYVNWLNSKVPGSPYRLPSEAEWEYAARAGSTSAFFWGNTISPANANYAGSVSYVGGGSTGVDYRQTVPVGSYPPNAFGLFDMLGNVKEWTQDIWHENYYGAPTDGSAWQSGSGYRVLRGGSWCGKPQALRAANRFRGGPELRNCGFGFRVARSLPQ